MSLERRALRLGAVVLALDTFGYALVMPLIPFAAQEAGTPAWAIGALFATFSACQLLAVPWLGRLADRVGTTPVLAGCLVGSAVGFALLVVSSEPWMMVASRVIDGLSAGNVAITYAMVVGAGRPADRGSRLGLLGAAMGVGLLAGVGAAALWASDGLRLTAAVATAASLLAAGAVLLRPVRVAAPSLAGRRLGQQWERPHVRQLAGTQLASSGAQAGFLLVAPVLFVAQLQVSLSSALAALVLFLVVGGAFQVLALPVLTRRLQSTTLVETSFALLGVGLVGACWSTTTPVVLVSGCVAAMGTALAAPPLAALWAGLDPDGTELGALMGLNASSSSAGQLVGPLVAYAGWAAAGAPGVALALVVSVAGGWLLLRRSVDAPS